MKDLKQLLSQENLEAGASQTPSRTEAGQTDPAGDLELVDAINQVFALFQINYHNQFYAAFGDSGDYENQAKRLWLDSLGSFNTPQILRAAKRIIQESEYLPTLQKMLDACTAELAEYGIPDVRQAYFEAANAASPKNAQKWSHPIVYLAGQSVGWYAMSHNSENLTYPAFQKAYRELVKQFLNGSDLKVDAPALIEQKPQRKADKNAVIKELATIHKLLKE